MMVPARRNRGTDHALGLKRQPFLIPHTQKGFGGRPLPEDIVPEPSALPLTPLQERVKHNTGAEKGSLQ